MSTMIFSTEQTFTGTVHFQSTIRIQVTAIEQNYMISAFYQRSILSLPYIQENFANHTDCYTYAMHIVHLHRDETQA